MPKTSKTGAETRSNNAAGPSRHLKTNRIGYPFTAIVGQEEMKLALLLSVIEPNIGGVIIMGHRGTGKSTAVRALADLLPPIRKVKGCFYGCHPDRPNELCNECARPLCGEGHL